MRQPFVITLTFFALLSIGRLSSLAFSEDFHWPGWLGPDRNGWVDQVQPPTRWPERLQLSWQVKVGTGYGSPLVVAGHVYQHARQGDHEVIWCLDLKTGNVKWRQQHPVPFKIRGGGERHGKGPKSCPLWADGHIFTMSITGVLSAWDASSGELQWRRDYTPQFKTGHPYWGASTSPIADGNRIFVHFGTDDAGVLVALNTKTGQEIWRHGKDGASYSSPLLLEIDGVRQVVQWNHRALVGVESTTGRALWEFPFPHVGSNQNMPTPAFYKDRILLSGENRGMVSLQPHQENGAWRVKELWFQKKVALDMSSAIVNDDLLYGFSHYSSGRLFCLEIETGKILWQGPGRTGDNATFLAIPNHVVALLDNGTLQVVATNRNRLQKVASYRVAKSSTWAPPVLLPGGFLVKDGDSLARWSLPQTAIQATSVRSR